MSVRVEFECWVEECCIVLKNKGSKVSAGFLSSHIVLGFVIYIKKRMRCVRAGERARDAPRRKSVHVDIRY
jgi:hypothetical protein